MRKVQTLQSNYIYGMKGVACFWVMIGHVIAIYKDSYGAVYEVIDGVYTGLYLFQNNVAMFALLSGFLLANTQFLEGKIECLLRKLVRRYTRFVIPIMMTCFFVVFVQNAVGYLREYDELLNYKDIFYFSFIEIFLGGTSYNGVFGMIGDMFWGGVTVIVLTFVVKKYPSKCYLIYLVAIVISYSIGEWVALDCLIGYFLHKLINGKEVKTGNKYILMIVISQIMSFIVRRLAVNYESLGYYFLQYSVFFCIIVFIAVLKTPILQVCFSVSPLVYLGKISFGIYCLHMPILCSFTGYVVEACVRYSLSSYLTVIIACLVTTIITLLSAVIFTHLEKNIQKLLQ